ncbi:hypothetical protein ACJW31_11G191200 [Castanea mollissima]
MVTSALHHCCSLFLLLLLLPLVPTVFTYTKDDCNILLNSPASVTDQDINTLFTSRSVWFTITKDQTIVWSANGNEPAPQGSTLTQNSSSAFVLNDPNGNELWKAPVNGSISSCAAILDNGNLVILDEQYNSIWESFKEPTDTILPGQILYMNTTLRSHQSTTNYSYGRFQLSLQLDGNLVLYSINMPSEVLNHAYFATMTMFWESQLIFTEAGYMYVQDANNSTNIFNLTQEDPGSKDSFYHMARIDYDGVFRIYKHLRQQDTSCGSCPSTWDPVQGIPGITDICGVFDANTFVGGFCGLNGVCRTSDASSGGETFCSCPYGFSQLNPYEDWAGCKPDFPLPNCDNGWEENKGQVSFVRLTNMDWPFTDYSLVQGANETECKQQCLDDCMCVVAIFEKTGGYCWKKKYPLSNGRYSTNITRIAFIKVPNSFVPVKKSQSVVVVLALLLGSSAFLNILFFIASIVAIIYLHHKKLNSPWNIDSTLATNVRSYTYKELEQATRGFKQIVGKGAFGTVYKGVLPSDSKRFVAVKKLGKVVEEGEKEFKTEVSVIGQTHHKNLVRLLGYSNFLFGISRPHWNQRVQIAFGIARGLMYLHEECCTQIIHCDIKPQNILLDEYFIPRIADFGLAKLLLAEQTRAARTGIRGTIGYFAPEWFRKASISVKVDVYSFGVMLLEIICCKSNKLIENDEEASNDMKRLERLERLVIVAIWCIQEDPSLRPSMKKITQMLEGVIEVFVPPSPSLYNYSPPSKSSSFEFSFSSVER